VIIEFGDLWVVDSDPSANISSSGMFITTSTPLPVGTRFRFVCKHRDRHPSFSGVAEVVWVCNPEESSPMIAGMGVRFVWVDDSDQSRLSHLQLGEEDGDLDHPRRPKTNA